MRRSPSRSRNPGPIRNPHTANPGGEERVFPTPRNREKTHKKQIRMAVRYYTDDCSYRLPQKRLTARWLREVAEAEGYVLGDVNYIFCSAARLL